MASLRRRDALGSRLPPKFRCTRGPRRPPDAESGLGQQILTAASDRRDARPLDAHGRAVDRGPGPVLDKHHGHVALVLRRLAREHAGLAEVLHLGRRHLVEVLEDLAVAELDAPPNACVLPAWAIDAVCEVSGGAFPSYADGYYERDKAAYIAWDAVSKSREQFTEWMAKHVLGTENFSEFRHLLAS